MLIFVYVLFGDLVGESKSLDDHSYYYFGSIFVPYLLLNSLNSTFSKTPYTFAYSLTWLIKNYGAYLITLIKESS